MRKLSDFIYFAIRWKPLTVTFNSPRFIWNLSKKRWAVKAYIQNRQTGDK